MTVLALNSSPQAGPDHRDRIIASLEEDNRDLQKQVAEARRELEVQRSESTRAVGELRRQLSPLYTALRMVFGEIDSVLPVDESAPTNQAAGHGREGKWDAIKQRMAPRLREAVDILLLQGSMKRTQLAAALKMDYSNCTKNVVGIMLRQGWLVDNGGNLSLKEL